MALPGSEYVISKRARSLLVLGVLVIASCGGSDRDGGAGAGSAGPSPAAGAQPSNAGSPLPAITVQDVTADREVALNSFIPSDRPTLLWFWAPH